MADLGDIKNTIDTQNAILGDGTNTYKQLYNCKINLDSNVSKHQLTDDTVHNVYSLNMISIEAVIVLTTVQWASLVTLYNSKDSKAWNLTWTDAATISKTTTFSGEIKTLSPIDVGLGPLTFSIVIECNHSIVVS
jgi:hypothetical protein